jgi:hypothetical protein
MTKYALLLLTSGQQTRLPLNVHTTITSLSDIQDEVEYLGITFDADVYTGYTLLGYEEIEDIIEEQVRFGPSTIHNIGMSAEYNGSGSIVITVHRNDGQDFSVFNKGYIAFRDPDSSNTTASGYTLQYLTSNLTFTINSGDSFGLASGQDDLLHVYLAYDSTNGVYPVVTCGLVLNSNDLTSTLNITPRTARYALYDPTGLTSVGANVAIRLLGYIKINEASAGTWTQDPVGVYLYQSEVTDEPVLVYGSYSRSTPQTIPTSTLTIVDYATSNLKTGWTATTGASWSARFYQGTSAQINARVTFKSVSDGGNQWTAGSEIKLWLYVNGAARHCLDVFTVPIDNLTTETFDGRITLQGVGEFTQFKPDTTFDIRVEHNDPASHDILGDGHYNIVSVGAWNKYTL